MHVCRMLWTVFDVVFGLPTEIWAISHDNTASTVFVRNLYWEGYGFYAALKSPEYGSAYFGTGIPNYDIAFSL